MPFTRTDSERVKENRETQEDEAAAEVFEAAWKNQNGKKFGALSTEAGTEADRERSVSAHSLIQGFKAETAEKLSEIFCRDARRYDGTFQQY